jgi:hypothetical protein
MTGPRTEADERFERYLREHGVAFECEPDWAAETGIVSVMNPDYLLLSPQRVIAEVKGFTTDRISRRVAGQRYGVLSDKEVFGPVRSAFAGAARQLAPFAATGLPLVVVLANPLGADVFLAEWHVQHALIGNPKFSIPISTTTGGQAGPGRWIADDYAVAIHKKSEHVSGVVVIQEREHATDWHEAEARKIKAEGDGFEGAADAYLKLVRVAREAEAEGRIPTGSYTWAEVFELHDLHSQPPPAIPAGIFAGPRDRRFGMDPSGEGYGELDGGRRVGS